MACDQHGAEHLGRVVAERPGEAARCLHSAEQRPGEAIRKRRVLVGDKLALPGPVFRRAVVRIAVPCRRRATRNTARRRAERRHAGSARRCRGPSGRRACGGGWNKVRSSCCVRRWSNDSAGDGERRDGEAKLVVIRRPALFQLRLPFVLGERIGIAEIGTKQALIYRSHANDRSRANDRALTSRLRISTAVAPAAPRACRCASAGAGRTKTLLRSRRTSRATARIHVASPSPHS